MLSDNSGYYVIQLYTGDIPHVLKYSFSSSTNQHYILNSMYLYAFGALMISDTELFWITKTTTPYNAVFIKFTFANTSADWAKQMSCSLSNWIINPSESLLSTDKSKIYTLFAYVQSDYNIYFSSFQTSSGAIVGYRYKSTSWSNSNYGVYGSVLNGDYILATLQCSSIYYLAIYNISSALFTFKSFSGTYLYDVTTESGSNR